MSYFILNFAFSLTLIFRGKNGVKHQVTSCPCHCCHQETWKPFSSLHPLLFTVRIMTSTVRWSNLGFLAQGSALQKGTWASCRSSVLMPGRKRLCSSFVRRILSLYHSCIRTFVVAMLRGELWEFLNWPFKNWLLKVICQIGLLLFKV